MTISALSIAAALSAVFNPSFNSAAFRIFRYVSKSAAFRMAPRHLLKSIQMQPQKRNVNWHFWPMVIVLIYLQEIPKAWLSAELLGKGSLKVKRKVRIGCPRYCFEINSAATAKQNITWHLWAMPIVTYLVRIVHRLFFLGEGGGGALASTYVAKYIFLYVLYICYCMCLYNICIIHIFT